MFCMYGFSICPICTEELKESLVSTKCGHVYHELCLSQWLDNGNSVCPTCRARTLKKYLLKIFLTSVPEVGLKHEEFEKCKKSNKELIKTLVAVNKSIAGLEELVEVKDRLCNEQIAAKISLKQELSSLKEKFKTIAELNSCKDKAYNEQLAIRMKLEQELNSLQETSVSVKKQLKNLKNRNSKFGKTNAKLNDEFQKSQQLNSKLNEEISENQEFNEQLEYNVDCLNKWVSAYKESTAKNTTKLNNEIHFSQELNSKLTCDITNLKDWVSAYKESTERNTTKLNDEIYKSRLSNNQLTCNITDLNNRISFYKKNNGILLEDKAELNDALHKSKHLNGKLKRDYNNLLETSWDSRDKLDQQDIALYKHKATMEKRCYQSQEQINELTKVNETLQNWRKFGIGTICFIFCIISAFLFLFWQVRKARI